MTSMQFGTTSTVTFWTPTPTPTPAPAPKPTPTPGASDPYAASGFATDTTRAKQIATDAGEWTGRLLGGVEAMGNSLASTLDDAASLHYLSGRNGAGAFVRQWSDETALFGRYIGAFGNGIGLAADVAEHGLLAGTIRSGLGNVASNMGSALGALVTANPYAKLAAIGLGAVGGDVVFDYYADRFDEGFAAGGQTYAETIAAGGTAQDAFVENVHDNNGWLTDDMPWWQRPLQFTVDGVRTFGSNLGVAYQATSDLYDNLFGDETATSGAAGLGDSSSFDATSYETSSYDTSDYGSDYGSNDFGSYEATTDSNDW